MKLRSWYQPPFFHAENPVAAPRERKIVRDKDRGEPMRTMQTFQQFEDHLTVAKVEIPRGFIGEQNRRIPNQCARQHYSLLFAAGQLPGAVRSPGPDSNLVQPGRGISGGGSTRNSANEKRHHHVFQCRELRQKIVNLPDKSNFPISKIRPLRVRQLRDLSTPVVYRAPGRPVQTAQQMQQGGLARAGFPHQGQHFSPCYFEVEVGEYDEVGGAGLIDFRQSAHANVRFIHYPTISHIRRWESGRSRGAAFQAAEPHSCGEKPAAGRSARPTTRGISLP